MTSFNVLDRRLDIHRSYFLEASAGTGKTFSIENLLSRFLLESKEGEEPLAVQQILVVTFTRAATRELKIRIRKHLEKLLSYVKDGEENGPDYLKALLEREGPLKAKRRLEKALSNFDEAQIYTIHGFCYRMLRDFALESQVCLSPSIQDAEVPHAVLRTVVRDFFRVSLKLPYYSAGQLALLLKHYRQDGTRLETAVIAKMDLDLSSYSLPRFSELHHQFECALSEVRKKIKTHVFEDLCAFAPFYKGFKPEHEKLFALLGKSIENGYCTMDEFDQLLQETKVFENFAPDNRNKKKKSDPSSSNYPHLINAILKQLLPILQTAGNVQMNLFRLAADCRRLLEVKFTEEEQWTPDETLRLMVKSLQDPAFCALVNERFACVVIDEFQDTDPLQWEIFSKGFLKEGTEKPIYLVGDPKQSIYGFRNADIYTYYSARDALGQNAQATLDTNFRSQRPLVEALNHLFSKTQGWMTLPKLGRSLSIQAVKPAVGKEESIEDGKGSLHFFLCEDEKKGNSNWPSRVLERDFLFPFIAGEIRRLYQEKGFSFSSFAVLVRDKYQAADLCAYLRTKQIPAVTIKTQSVLDSSAYEAMLELLQAVSEPSSQSKIRQVLGGKLFHWIHTRLKGDLHDFSGRFFQWKELLEEKGFAYFLQDLLDQEKIIPSLLQEEGGLSFYKEFWHVANLLIEEEVKVGRSVDLLLHFLLELKSLELDDELLKLPPHDEEEAVSILTMHLSKGLEFDIVFALGLINRNRNRQQEDPYEILGLDPQIERQEIDAEKMRQLYVAMTRAKWRLYVPILFEMNSKPIDKGMASPMELFAACLGQEKVIENIYERIGNKEAVLDYLQTLPADLAITYSFCQASDSLEASITADKEVIVLNEPKEGLLSFPRQFLTSYTSLAKMAEPLSEEGRIFREVPEGELPAGPETGILLHLLLEKIDYGTPITKENISDFLEQTSLSLYGEKVAQLLQAALATPLSLGNATIILSALPKACRFHEMEFLYSVPEGLRKGSIDLVFLHEDKYYIIDWKSNFLGADAESYLPDRLVEEMKQHHYYLQANIYAEGLKRFLALFEKRPFEECFGGAIYLFLRGIVFGQGHGVLHFFPQVEN